MVYLRIEKNLLKVAKLGPKAFEQCAGFLRISEGTQPLDATSVHPESYGVAEALLKQLGYSKDELKKGAVPGLHKKIRDYKKLAEELGIGETDSAGYCRGTGKTRQRSA